MLKAFVDKLVEYYKKGFINLQETFQSMLSESRNERTIKYVVTDIIGNSLAIRQLRMQIGRIAESDSTVLITGKTGCGKAYNLDKMEQYIHSVMSKYPDTRLIVFPELCTTGYEGTPELFQELAETINDGESIRRIGSLAKKYHTHIVYGFAERDTVLSDVLYNAAVIIDEDGRALGSYHKAHPFADEKRWCRAGSSLPIFDTALGRIGIQICWDTAFPEISRCYAVNGADLLVVSTNWENPYEIPGWTRGTLPNPHAEDWDRTTLLEQGKRQNRSGIHSRRLDRCYDSMVLCIKLR